MIAQILDAFYQERQRQDEVERAAVNKYRMSDAGKCRLMRYWKRQGKPRTSLALEVLRPMQAGIVLHEFLGQVIAASVRPIGGARLEGTVEDDHRIGHYDIWAQTSDKSYLIDLKTVSGKKANYLAKYGTQPDMPHRHQIVSYASLLPERPDELLIVYVNRESLAVAAEYAVNYDLTIKDVEEDWRILIDAWIHQQSPEANPDSNWECQYCPYSAACPNARVS